MSRQSRREAAATAGIGGVGCVVLIVAVIALIAVGLAIQWIFAPFQGKVDARNKTVGDGSYRIAQYNYFYEQCGAVQTLEGQIDVQADNAVPEQATNVAALQSQRVALITQYNAKAREAATAGQFKASDLPYALDTDTYQPNGEHATCTA